MCTMYKTLIFSAPGKILLKCVRISATLLRFLKKKMKGYPLQICSSFFSSSAHRWKLLRYRLSAHALLRSSRNPSQEACHSIRSQTLRLQDPSDCLSAAVQPEQSGLFIVFMFRGKSLEQFFCYISIKCRHRFSSTASSYYKNV